MSNSHFLRCPILIFYDIRLSYPTKLARNVVFYNEQKYININNLLINIIHRGVQRM